MTTTLQSLGVVAGFPTFSWFGPKYYRFFVIFRDFRGFQKSTIFVIFVIFVATKMWETLVVRTGERRKHCTHFTTREEENRCSPVQAKVCTRPCFEADGCPA